MQFEANARAHGTTEEAPIVHFERDDTLSRSRSARSSPFNPPRLTASAAGASHSY
jgi:hypothetical protein